MDFWAKIGKMLLMVELLEIKGCSEVVKIYCNRRLGANRPQESILEARQRGQGHRKLYWIVFISL